MSGPRSRAERPGPPRPPARPRIRFELAGTRTGGVRRLVRLGADDAAGFARAVGVATPAIERSLGPEVLANRAGRGLGALAPWPVARRTWRAEVERQLRDRRHGIVLVADVRDCYASIGSAAVLDALRAAGVRRRDVAEIVAWLTWFGDAGIAGLPVGPAPSAVLANAVLASGDRALRQTGAPFLRWVDDVVTFTEDRGRAVAALDALRRSLGRAGLDLHTAKTRIVTEREEARHLLLGGRLSLPAGRCVS